MDKLVAHRGYSAKAPENTLSAYQLAQSKGYQYVECDLHFTKDGVPVLIHDETIDRTSNKKGLVEDYSFNQLKTLDFGSWFSKGFKNESIISLDEFIQYCAQYNLHPYLELKNANLNEFEILTLYKIVERHHYLDHVTWISFNINNLKAINRMHPQARLGIIGKFNHDLIKKYYELKTLKNEVFLNVHKHYFDRSLVWFTTLTNIRLEVWTVNTNVGARYFFNHGISRITTNQLTDIDLHKPIRYQFKITL